MHKKFAITLAATIAATGIVALAAHTGAPAPAADQQCTTDIPVGDINNIIPTVRAPQPNGTWMVNPNPATSHFNSCTTSPSFSSSHSGRPMCSTTL